MEVGGQIMPWPGEEEEKKKEGGGTPPPMSRLLGGPQSVPIVRSSQKFRVPARYQSLQSQLTTPV
jgi:hypothetical protein